MTDPSIRAQREREHRAWRERDREMRAGLQKQEAAKQAREQRRALNNRRDNFEVLERELASLRAAYTRSQQQQQEAQQRRAHLQRMNWLLDSLGANQEPPDPNDPMLEIDQLLKQNMVR